MYIRHNIAALSNIEQASHPYFEVARITLTTDLHCFICFLATIKGSDSWETKCNGWHWFFFFFNQLESTGFFTHLYAFHKFPRQWNVFCKFLVCLVKLFEFCEIYSLKNALCISLLFLFVFFMTKWEFYNFEYIFCIISF